MSSSRKTTVDLLVVLDGAAVVAMIESLCRGKTLTLPLACAN